MSDEIMDSLGTQLEKLFNTAQTEIFIAAPFIKATILKEIFTCIKPEVTIKCVTRWLIEEIIIGVSDLEIWSIIQSHPNASLWLRNDLHAKYYRADDQCLIGSANLTAKALGWSNRPNLELLVEIPADYSLLPEFEPELFQKCIQVDEQLYNEYLTRINQIENQDIPLEQLRFSVDLSSDIVNNETWIPTLRNPEELYFAYSGKEGKLTQIARNSAINDLKYLNIIPNLNQNNFNAYVGIKLLEKPIIQAIDNFVSIPQAFGKVRDFLASLLCANLPDLNPERAWQTLMRWLLYFLPSRYALSIPSYSEVFYRIK